MAEEQSDSCLSFADKRALFEQQSTDGSSAKVRTRVQKMEKEISKQSGQSVAKTIPPQPHQGKLSAIIHPTIGVQEKHPSTFNDSKTSCDDEKKHNASENLTPKHPSASRDSVSTDLKSPTSTSQSRDSVSTDLKQPSISVKRTSGNNKWMEEPMPFIQTDDEGKMYLNEEVKPFLGDLHGVSVISVIGKYRTGKSYIMNRFFGRNAGFHLGDTVQAKTKGIWIWIGPHPVHTDLALILLDIEGLSDVMKRQQSNDMQLFCLAVLLSKVMVYNVMRVIDSSMIQDLNLVTELTKHLKVDGTTKSENGASFKLHFPCLVFLLRDCDLLLQHQDGKEMNPDEYLEEILEPSDGFDEISEAYNKQRRCITQFFIDRKCYTMCKPVDDPEKLHRLDKLDDSEIKPEFLKQANQASNKILHKAVQLNVKELKCDGKGFWELTTIYVQAMNANKVPCISNALDILKDQAHGRACSSAIAKYNECMKIEMPVSTDELEQHHKKAHTEACGIFMENTYFDDKKKTEKFMDILEERYQDICRTNDEKSTQKCEQTLQACFKDLNSNFLKGVYNCHGGYALYKNERDEATKTYDETPNKGPMHIRVLNNYLECKKNEEVAIIDIDKKLDQQAKKDAIDAENFRKEKLKRKQTEEENRRIFVDNERRDNEHFQLLKILEAKMQESNKEKEMMLNAHMKQIEDLKNDMANIRKGEAAVSELNATIKSMQKQLKEIAKKKDQESIEKEKKLSEALQNVQKSKKEFDGVLGKPQNLCAEEVGQDYIEISWNPPVEQDEYVTSYEIRCQNNDGNTLDYRAHKSKTTYKWKELKSGTKHYITVTAMAGCQKSEPSETLTVDTEKSFLGKAVHVIKFW